MSKRLTPQQCADRELLEDEFRDQVNELAAIYGWTWVWVHPLRAAGGIWKTPTFGPLGKGWVDTVYINPRTRRVLFVEFKRELGKTTPDQDRVHDVLRSLEYNAELDDFDTGIEVHVWRPSDFPSIQEVLAR